MASFFLFDTQPAIHAAADSAAVIVDTARVSAAHEESENLFTHLLKHVQDAHELETPFGRIELPHLHLLRRRHVDNETRCFFVARRGYACHYSGSRCTEK